MLRATKQCVEAVTTVPHVLLRFPNGLVRLCIAWNTKYFALFEDTVEVIPARTEDAG